MKNTTYNTGRVYGKPQILNITIESVREDDLGDRHVIAKFVDESRSISGTVQVIILSFEGDLLKSLGPAVKDAYDAGRYSLI